MVPPRLVPANPQTNTLYPGAESSTPIFKARKARSCPIKPSRGSACAVVSNGIRESSHLQRSLSVGSSAGFGAGFVAMKSFRAGYSSTLATLTLRWAGQVLPSGYRRALRALAVDVQNSSRYGNQNRPQHKPEQAKQIYAAHHTDRDPYRAQFSPAAQQQWQQYIVQNRRYAGTDRKEQNH